MLYNLADGLRAIAVALAPYLPESAPRILEALGQPRDDCRWSGSQPAGPRRRRGIEPAAPLFPRVERPAARCVIDTHAHLDAVREPAGRARRARARPA